MWVWAGFWRLSASRPSNMAGPTRVPPSDILAYATLQGWSGDKSREFLFYMDAMDSKYMEFVEEEQTKQRDEQERKQRLNQQRRR